MNRAGRRTELPPDGCPYPRPFPDGFSDCPAYQFADYVGLGLDHKPRPGVRSCSHLTGGPLPGRTGGYYARCRVGDAEARRRWAEAVSQERLEKIRRIQRDYAAVMEPLVRELWEAKSLEVSARREAGGPRLAESQRALREVASRFLQSSEAHLSTRDVDLEEVKLPADACNAVIAAAMAAWVESPDSTLDFEIPSDLLERFPREARVFLQPGLVSS